MAFTNFGLLVTLLAFIFIPLSLGTSIFGMNVQEINGSGHGIWVFVVTTTGLLVIAVILFFLSKRIVEYCRRLINKRNRSRARRTKAKDVGIPLSVWERIFLVPR